MPSEQTQASRWAIAYQSGGQQVCVWARDLRDSIVIFGSRAEAEAWAFSHLPCVQPHDEILFVRIPA